MTHPPKPIPALRVGVTGHRRIDAADTQAAWAAIRASIDSVLSAADAALVALAADPAFDQEAGTRKRLLSALAEGADRVAADAALDAGWALHAVLPLSPPHYAADFDDAESRAHFDTLLGRSASVLDLAGDGEPGAPRNEAYALGGRVVVENSDLLIAVWNGAPARGRGGTEEVVRMALERGALVVRCRPDAPETLETLSKIGAEWTKIDPATLADRLCERLAPPAPNSTARTRLDRFQNEEREHRRSLAVAYDWMVSLVLGRKLPRGGFNKRRDAVDEDACWVGFFDSTPVAGAAGDAHRAVARPYAWADHLSIHYADNYRSSYVANFLLAGLAVFVGLLGLLTSTYLPGLSDWPKFPFVAAELALIVLIIGITYFGRRNDWHRRWLDYRLLAELLRLARLGVAAGHNVGPPSTERRGESEESAWVIWRVRAAQREAPVIAGRLAAKERTAVRDRIAEEEIEPQIAYHLGADGTPGNAKRMKTLAHRIEGAAEWLFVATAVLGVLYLGLLMMIELGLPGWPDKDSDSYSSTFKLTESLIKYGGAILMGALPAFGAALSGIVAQGDFEGSADRSERIGARLQALRARLHAEEKAPDFGLILALIDDIAEIEITDLSAWRTLYARKILRPPA
jgi:hypothetical protein